MKKEFYFFMVVLISTNCFAQTSNNKIVQPKIEKSDSCDGTTELLTIKGKWNKDNFDDGGGYKDKTFPANKNFEVMDRLGKILPMLKEGIPDLGGLETSWHRAFLGNSNMIDGPIHAFFSNLLFEYYCNENLHTISLAEETFTKVEIYYNAFGLFGNKVAEWDINNDGKSISIYQLPDTIGRWKGVSLYQPEQISNATNRAVVLTHNKQLPWHTLTRKQYLTGYKNYLENIKREQLEGISSNVDRAKENIAAIKANNALTPEQKNSAIEKLEKQLKKFHDDTQQKYREAVEKVYNDNVKLVNNYLDTASAETLNQHAVIDKKAGFGFKGYFAEAGQSGIKFICATSKYFDKVLPRYVPQFIVMYWSWGKEPAYIKFAKQFEEKFPLEKLKALIDK